MGELRNSTNFLFYATENGTQNIRVFLDEEGETIWMTQKEMSAVFGIGIPGISKHLSKIFADEELLENSVVSNLETTAEDGKKYKTSFYNLDAIISVGYRVTSKAVSNQI